MSTRDIILYTIVIGYIVCGVMFTLLVKLKLLYNKIEYYSSKGILNTLKFIGLWVYYIRFYIYTYPDYAWILLSKKNIFGYPKVAKVYLKPIRDLNKSLSEINDRFEKCKEEIKRLEEKSK